MKMSGEAGWTPRVSPFKSLKVIGIDTVRSGRYRPTFHSNHAWAYLVPFPRFSEILAENCEFSHVRNLYAFIRNAAAIGVSRAIV